MEAQENCSIRTHCPSGLRTDCPGGFCWTVSKPGCNILDFASASLPLSQTPTEFPSRILLPTRAPLYSPTAEPTEKPTASVLTDSDERNSLYCGTSWSDANSKCKVECPFMTGCPPGETCFNTECSISPTNEQIPDPIETITSSPITLAPTNPLETPYPTPYPISEETGPPTVRPSPNPTARPTNKPTSKSAVATVPNPPTAGPTMSPKSGVRIAYFPNAEAAVPKPPTSYAQRIQRIVQSIQPSFEDEIFVVELRSGAQVQSSLYTFNGFLKSLEFYTQLGVNDRYLYLGQDNSRSGTETFDDGIANLALFLAKMMDTIAHERCDPDKISCGFPALDSIFEDQDLRVECSPSSSDAEMNCPAQSGCVCILGILNHKITDGKYSGVDFCDSNRLQSICSRRTDQGEELRWIAAMSHWVFFVQQYNEEWNYLEELRNFVRGGMVDLTFVGTVAGLSVLDTETTTYLDSSNRKFEQNFFKAMIKLSEGMSQPYSQEPDMTTVRPTPKPVQYLAQTSGPRTTSPPTEDFTSINNLNGEPTDKPVSAMGWYEELGLGAGDNSSPSSISSGFAPSAGVSQLPASSSPVSAGVVTSTENSHLPGVSAGHSSFPPSVTYVTATGENSQSPVFSADSPLSPVPAGIATAAEDGQMPTMSSDYISTLPVSIGDATTTENYKTTTSPAGYNSPPLISAEGNAASGEHPVLSSGDSSPSPVSAYDATEANDGKPPALYPSSTVAGSSSSVSPSPIPRQHWEYEDVPWYRGYVTGHSRGTRSRVSDCIRIIMVVTFCSFMF